MKRTTVVFSCYHADPHVDNKRADALGKFLYALRPDMVIDLGDGADMRSLSSYDTPSSMESYDADIQSYNDAMERMRRPFKLMKKKRPFWVGYEGNHEFRITKAIKKDPRLSGQVHGLSFGHLQTDYWFDEYHRYEHSAPAIASYDGIAYAHYFTTGNSSTATGGIHHAYTLTQNLSHSATCGHSHKRDIYFKDGAYPRGIIGAVVGCFKGKEEDWAGQSNKGWWNGVLVKHELENGTYEPQWVSLETILKEFG